jgi:hypothetical protein
VPAPSPQPRPAPTARALPPCRRRVQKCKLDNKPQLKDFCPEYFIASHWKKYCEGSKIAKRPAIGDDWRVARNIVIAETDTEARDRVMDPAGSNYHYFDYLWKVLKSVDYTAVMKSDPKARTTRLQSSS